MTKDTRGFNYTPANRNALLATQAAGIGLMAVGLPGGGGLFAAGAGVAGAGWAVDLGTNYVRKIKEEKYRREQEKIRQAAEEEEFDADDDDVECGNDSPPIYPEDDDSPPIYDDNDSPPISDDDEVDECEEEDEIDDDEEEEWEEDGVRYKKGRDYSCRYPPPSIPYQSSTAIENSASCCTIL